jgi:hypothetical protein
MTNRRASPDWSRLLIDGVKLLPQIELMEEIEYED